MPPSTDVLLALWSVLSQLKSLCVSPNAINKLQPIQCRSCTEAEKKRCRLRVSNHEFISLWSSLLISCRYEWCRLAFRTTPTNYKDVERLSKQGFSISAEAQAVSYTVALKVKTKFFKEKYFTQNKMTFCKTLSRPNPTKVFPLMFCEMFCLH